MHASSSRASPVRNLKPGHWLETLMLRRWKPRSPERLPDPDWRAALLRVRGEFEEMPCLRVSAEQARLLFGLTDPLSSWVLSRLIGDGFLEYRNGEYLRRNAEP